MVLWYMLVGVVICLFFDLILMDGEHQLENLERVLIIFFWPVMLVWFIFYLIKHKL